jgi:serine/threonine-protein kinase RsbW
VKDTPNHKLVIKSELHEIRKVEQFLKEIFRFHQLPDACFNKVFLCVSEAVNNSIVHGNKKVAHKQIEVHINCKQKSVEVVVSDEGDGFDISKIPDPTHSENILNESGRGIHIIKSISDVMEYKEETNSLHFQINCK